MWPGDEEDEQAYWGNPRAYVKRDALFFMERALHLVQGHEEAAQVWATLAQAAATRQLALATERNGRPKG
jgi:hypothetical protein